MLFPTLAPELLSQYLETEFHVYCDAPFAFRIGVYSAEIHALHQNKKSPCSAFVTACNPFSRSIGDKVNNRLHAELIDGQLAKGFQVIEGEGRHPGGSWAAEKSCLIFSADENYAVGLGKRFKQHAVVFIGVDAIPRLVCIKDHTLTVHETLDVLQEHIRVLECSIRDETTPESTILTMVRRQRLYDAIDKAVLQAT